MKKEAKRLEARADKRLAFEDTRDENRYQTNLAAARQTTREEQRRYAAESAERTEQKQYDRGMTAVSHILNVLGQKPELENRMMQVFPSRRYF